MPYSTEHLKMSVTNLDRIENGYLLVDLRSALFDSRFNSFEDEIDSKMTVPFWKKYVGLRVETLVCLSLACPPGPARVRVMFYITVLTNLAITKYPYIMPRQITVVTFCFRVFRFDFCMKKSFSSLPPPAPPPAPSLQQRHNPANN